MLYSHRGKDNSKFGFCSAYLCLPGNLSGKFIMGQAVTGKDRKFLGLHK